MFNNDYYGPEPVEDFDYQIITPGIYPEERLTRATRGSVGFDLRSTQNLIIYPSLIAPEQPKLIPLGIKITIPDGYEAQIRMRSGLGLKGFCIPNGIGTIDQDYEGELKLILIYLGSSAQSIDIGDRVAQLVLSPVYIPPHMKNDYREGAVRGSGGFGSTGVS